MEPVAADTLFAEAPREGECLGKIRLAAVEGRVEAGDLRNLRRSLHNRPDRREVMRLMQGRQRLELREVAKHRLGHPDRRAVVEAAVNHAVTESNN